MSIFFIPYGFYGWVENWVAPFACHTQVKFKEENGGQIFCFDKCSVLMIDGGSWQDL